MKRTRFFILTVGPALFCASCAQQATQAPEPAGQAAKKEVAKTTAVKGKPKAAAQTVTKTKTQTSAPKQNSAPKPPTKPASQPDTSSQVKQVKQAEKPQAPISVKAASLFRTPAEDINLPTDAEIAEGQNVSGGKKPATGRDTAPSISVKPQGSPTDPGP